MLWVSVIQILCSVCAMVAQVGYVKSLLMRRNTIF